ncbi:hypothetical protein BU15DRAFT_61624 [Melanogaster broomeanus]|nr:hypothetical protein BU15DRAFT_61624 [Melanogaster broomeanus]
MKDNAYLTSQFSLVLLCHGTWEGIEVFLPNRAPNINSAQYCLFFLRLATLSTPMVSGDYTKIRCSPNHRMHGVVTPRPYLRPSRLASPGAEFPPLPDLFPPSDRDSWSVNGVARWTTTPARRLYSSTMSGRMGEVIPLTLLTASKTAGGLTLYGKNNGDVGRAVLSAIEGPYGGPGHAVFASCSAAMFIVRRKPVRVLTDGIRGPLKVQGGVKLIDLICPRPKPAPHPIHLLINKARRPLKIAVHYAARAPRRPRLQRTFPVRAHAHAGRRADRKVFGCGGCERLCRTGW